VGILRARTDLPLNLGGRVRPGLNYYQGLLDEVSLYTRPLAITEITALHQAGAAGKLPLPRNAAPVIAVSPTYTAVVGQPLSLNATVTDDGLPSGGVLTSHWALISGPGLATFVDTALPATTVTFDAAGTYLLRLTATDTVFTAQTPVNVTVLAPLPNVTFTSPAEGTQLISGRPVTLSATATVSPGSIDRVEFYDGAVLLGNVGTPASASTYSLSFPGGFSTGTHTLTARAITAVGASADSAPVTITAAPYSGPEIVEFSSPLDSVRVSAPTPVTGIVALDALESWKVEYRLTPAEGSPDSLTPWIPLAAGTDYVGTPAVGSTPATPGTLGTLDPTLLLNGLYQIRLSATTTTGTTTTTGPVTVLVEGNMKVGAFSIAFNDLVEQTSGLPITLTRTYDSRDRRVGDFGPGWHLSLGNIRVQKNRHLGLGWWQTPQSGNGIQFYDVLPIDDRLVTIVMPDGETHRFRAGAYVKNRAGDPDYSSFAVVVRQGSYRFHPIGDTTSTLEPITYGGTGEPVLADRFWLEGTGDQDLYVGDSGDGDPFPEPYNPTRFRLTTADGTVMLIDQALGLLELRDPTGNRLVIHRHPASDGAALAGRIDAIDSIQAHADGPITRTVEIARHPDGRIDYLTDLVGRTLDYLYDPQGRLDSFTDRESNITQFRYERSDDPAHPLFSHLTRIIDPRGLPALRCEYDDDGRLVKQIDADGRETVFDRGIDAGARFERVTDRLGHPTTYFYDERGNVTSRIDPLGAVTAFDYYPGSDRVKFEEDHYGNVKAFAYDARGNVTVEILGASRTQEPATATTGYITRTTYTTFGAPLSITDADGRLQSFTYDPTTRQLLTHTVGQLAPGANSEIESAPLATTTYTYHPDGNLHTVTDALGNVTTTTYAYGISDAAHPGAVKRVTTTVVDPAGAPGSDPVNPAATTLRTACSYHDAQENLLATVTPRTLADGSVENIVTRYSYDSENRLKATIQPDGQVSETRYTAFGQTDKTLLWKSHADYQSGSDALARVTSYGYDNRGNHISTTYPDGTTETQHYDLENRRAWSENRLGHRTIFQHDAAGRLRFTLQPDTTPGDLTDNPKTETVYDLVGRVTDTYDELRHRTRIVYYPDGTPDAGRRKQSVQVLGTDNLVTEYGYYPSGQVRSVTDPRGNTTETRYDDHGRPTTVIYPATDEHPVTRTSTKYNVLGQRIETVDQEGKLTRHRYDGVGRLVEVRQYLDQVLAASDAGFTLSATSAGIVSTKFAYDEAGRQQTQTDALGRVTTYVTDVMGRRIKRILPDLAAENLGYDTWGRLSHRQDFAGKTTTYAYDVLDRLKSKTADATHPSLVHSHAIARVEYDYDATGAREAARTYNASGLLLYTETTPRDERGRIDYKDTPEGRLDYGYYANGLLRDAVSSNADGVNIGYRHDDANRLAYVDDATDGLPVRATSYAYNANGSLEALTYANGVRHAYGYDALNRLRTLNVARTAGAGSALHGYDYALRASGHRRQVTEGAKVTTFAYDDLCRLTGETIVGAAVPNLNGAISYALDKVGNRQARTSTMLSVANSANTFNARDWLNTDAYDANGNTLAGRTAGLAPAIPDIYDFEDRLIVRRQPDGSSIYLGYDADGVLRRKTVLDSSSALLRAVSHLVDGNNLTGYAQVVEERTTEASGTTRKVYTYGSDLISVSESSAAAPGITTRYYVYDGGGSVRELTDETGAVTDTYDYDAFGILVYRTGTSDNAHLYRGERFDADLGLYYLRARFMNPDSGRFWNQDTYEGSNSDPASLHKYNYGSSNPVMFSDPTGNYSLGELQIVTGVIGNLARIAIPSIVNRFAGTIAFNIFRGMFAAEKALLWLEVGTAVVGGSLFVAEGVDAMAENLLRNSQPVSDGPFPESTGRGNLVERIANPNLGGNVNIIDDLTDGIGTSVKSRGLSGGESAYLKQILADVQDVAKAPTSRIRGTTANGRRVDLLPGAVRQPALLVGVPQNHSRMLLSPTFRAALESYRRNYGVVIRVVPVGGWTKR
jgi:RHS repeat-associated protein